MREKEIDEFCTELASIWKNGNNCGSETRYWDFPHLILDVLRSIKDIDVEMWSNEKMMEYFKEYFNVKDWTDLRIRMLISKENYEKV